MLTGVLGSYDPTRHRIRTTAAVTALLAAALAGPPMVSAATTPAVNGTSLTFTGDGAGDTLVIGESGGLLTQSVNGATASTDFGGGTTLPANNTINTVVNAGGGDDTMTSDPAVTTAMLLNGGTGADSLQGGGGADLIQAGEDADTLTGGPGPDRLGRPVRRVPGRRGRRLHRHRDADHRQGRRDRLAADDRRARQRA